MADVLLRIDFDDLLDLLDQLSPDQKRQVREHLDAAWAIRFGQALDAIQGDIPPDISADETTADIEQAIREVRAGDS